MFWSKKAYRRTNTRSPSSTHSSTRAWYRAGGALVRAPRAPASVAYAWGDAIHRQPRPRRDGTDLLVRHWPADEAEAGGAWAGRPWASVLLVHGLGEHSGRYEHVGDQLTGAGLEVAAYDHRGMGGSGGRRGDVERWSQYHDDLEDAAGRAPGRARGPTRGAVRPFARRADRGGLPADRPAEARLSRCCPRPHSIRRCRVGRSGCAGRSPGSPRPPRSPTASTARPCRATRRSPPGRSTTRSASRSAPRGSGRSRSTSSARPGGRAGRGFGIPTLVLHGEDDGWSRRQRRRCSPTRRWSSVGPTRVCATSSTTSPKGRRSSTRSSPGCDSDGRRARGARRPIRRTD